MLFWKNCQIPLFFKGDAATERSQMGSIAFLIISDNSGNILYGVLKGFIPEMVV